MSAQLLTASQLAAHLGVSKATVLRRAREGAFPVQRLGTQAIRFVLSDVLAATSERAVVKVPAPHPKVTRLSQEDRDFFNGRQARGSGRTAANKKAARSS